MNEIIRMDGFWHTFHELQPREMQRRVAELAAHHAAKVLGIRKPRVRFFYRGYHPRALYGFTESPHEIWIGDDLGDLDTAKTTIHEVRHCWQCYQPEWARRSKEQLERDARLFELEWPR